MNFEDWELVVAFMSGEIYLTKNAREGLMGDKRQVMTNQCLRATVEWFMTNKKKSISFEHKFEDNKKPSLFFTDDPEKAERILKILKEEVNQ